MLTYQDCKELIKRSRTGEKKLALNTYLVELENGNFAVRVHNTHVVTIRRNGTFVLNSGGWWTNLTRNRINQFSPARLYQKAGEWFLWTKKTRWGWKSVEFFNNMKIDLKGLPVG